MREFLRAQEQNMRVAAENVRARYECEREIESMRANYGRERVLKSMRAMYERKRVRA